MSYRAEACQSLSGLCLLQVEHRPGLPDQGCCDPGQAAALVEAALAALNRCPCSQVLSSDRFNSMGVQPCRVL